MIIQIVTRIMLHNELVAGAFKKSFLVMAEIDMITISLISNNFVSICAVLTAD